MEPLNEPLYPAEEGFYYYQLIGWKDFAAGGYDGANALARLRQLAWWVERVSKKWKAEDRPGVRADRREADPMSLRLVWDIVPGRAWESGELWLTPHRELAGQTFGNCAERSF